MVLFFLFFFFKTQIYLEELVSIWPRFQELGDPGHLLMTRFYSIPRGLNHPEASIAERIEFWVNTYNKRYFQR